MQASSRHVHRTDLAMVMFVDSWAMQRVAKALRRSRRPRPASVEKLCDARARQLVTMIQYHSLVLLRGGIGLV